MAHYITVDDCGHDVFSLDRLAVCIPQLLNSYISNLGRTSIFSGTSPFLTLLDVIQGLAVYLCVSKKVLSGLGTDIVQVQILAIYIYLIIIG